MKITRIDTHLTELANRSIPYVVVHTDEGIHGVGEPFSCGPDGATVAAIHDFAEWLTGRDPRDVEGLYHLMYAGGALPRRLRRQRRHQRHRTRTVGHRRQSCRPARVQACRRQSPQPGSRLPKHRRRYARRGGRRRRSPHPDLRLYRPEDGPTASRLAPNALEPRPARDREESRCRA